MNNIQNIIRYSKAWEGIGIETVVCNVEKLFGIKKLYRKSVRITEEIQGPYNFLGVILTNSPIMCLDIEGDPGSVEEFMKILTENSIDLNDLLYETTLNNGLHLYFRIDPSIKGRNQYKKIYNDLHFDVLFTGKSFTAPSEFNHKKYSELNRSIFNIESIYDIPEFPESLIFLI